MNVRGPIFLGCFVLATAASAVLARAAGGPVPEMLTYKLEPSEPLKYKLSAVIKGTIPLGDAAETNKVTATLNFTYTAVPKTRLKDGSSDVDFEVSAVDFEVEKFPITIPDDIAQKLLNLTVTLANNGQVVKMQSKPGEFPFSISVPGVDPQRLYALLFPIVFQRTPVKVGDSWSYKSELLGGAGTRPKFTATYLPAAAGASSVNEARLKQQFVMAVDQKVNADKKPAKNTADVHRQRLGKIDGEGIYVFDTLLGRVMHGDVTIRANIKDNLIGKPLNQDEPKSLVSTVQAKVTIDLVTAAPQDKDAKPNGTTIPGEPAKKGKP